MVCICGVHFVYCLGMYMKTILENDNEQFIPTLERWVELYSQWFKLLVRALGMFASKPDCEEAVQEAFLKVMGLSPNLKLRKPLQPKTLKEWHGFLYWQARGILGHMQSKAARFELKETLEGPSMLTNRVGRLEYLRRVICKAVDEVCRHWQDAEAKARAFVMFELDEVSAEEVVAAVPEILNPNNLYQICSRVRLALAREACRPNSYMARLRSA